jgi:hypothetical protein
VFALTRFLPLFLLSVVGILAQTPGPLSWSRYLPAGNTDVVVAVRVDAAGDVWIAGHSAGTFDAYGANEPYQVKKKGGTDIFVARFRPFPDGSAIPIFFTWLGGGGNEELVGMEFDNKGRIVLAGTTLSNDFPIAGDTPQTAFGGDVDTFVSVIDPNEAGKDSLVYSTYYGGGKKEMARAVGVSVSGEIAVVGNTDSTDLPGTSASTQATLRGGVDTFVIRMNPDGGGKINYATYFGGTGTDVANGVAIDRSGVIWMVGYTGSDDFPLTAEGLKTASTGYFEGFLVGLDPAQPGLSAHVYGSFVGGSGSDEARTITIDAFNQMWISGQTFSTDFPVTANATQRGLAGGTDAFVMKLVDPRSGPGSVRYASYLGGSGFEFSYGLAVIDQNRFAIAGYTMSGQLPVTATAYRRTAASAFPDGYVMVVDSSVTGSAGLEYASYFGGSSTDVINSIAVDRVNPGRSLFFGGYTVSPDLPVTDGTTRGNPVPGANAFVTKLNR